MQQLETEYMAKLQIPYRSQRESEIIENYGSRGCGVTALSMVLDYYGHHLSGSELKKLADEVSAYKGNLGWTHEGLVKIARKLGLEGYRINYDFKEDSDMLKAVHVFTHEGASKFELARFKKSFEFAKKKGGYADIERLVGQRIPVIASLVPEYTGLTYSHLVVISDIDEKMVLVNDPWNNGKDYQLERDEFEKYWTRRVIVIYNGD